MHMGSSMLVAGETNCGKTEFIINFLAQAGEIFDIAPKAGYWFYEAVTKRHALLKQRGYIMQEGLPDNFDNIPANSAIVIDDLMEESKDTATVTSLFTKLAHRKPYFVVFSMQNFFFQSREARNRTLNVQYMVIFKTPRDSTQITHLGS